MNCDDESSEATRWSGLVHLWRADRLLGVLHVDLATGPDRVRSGIAPDQNEARTWAGRVRGSDYLVWGANLTKSQIEFPWGERAEVVLRSGGRVQGLGPCPTPLADDFGATSPSGSARPSPPNPDQKER